MKRITRISLKVAAIFIPIGIAFIIIGLFTGAKKGLYISNGGIDLRDSQEYSYENFDLTGINSINVDVSNAKIMIKESNDEKYGIDVNLSSILNEPFVGVEDRTLKVEVNLKDSWSIFSWDFSWLDENSNIVTIYIPKNSALENVTLHTSNGAIEINKLTAKNVKADSSNGAIITDNVVFTGNTALTTSNGRIELNGTFSDVVYAKTSSGKIAGAGTFKGTTTFKTSNGAITLDNAIKRSDCNISADTSNGSIRVDGSKVGDDFVENNKSTNSIELKTSNGSIAIDFQ